MHDVNSDALPLPYGTELILAKNMFAFSLFSQHWLDAGPCLNDHFSRYRDSYYKAVTILVRQGLYV